MDSELNYLCFFNIHNGDDPLLNFEFVKSAKLFIFFHCFILAGCTTGNVV